MLAERSSLGAIRYRYQDLGGEKHVKHEANFSLFHFVLFFSLSFGFFSVFFSFFSLHSLPRVGGTCTERSVKRKHLTLKVSFASSSVKSTVLPEIVRIFWRMANG